MSALRRRVPHRPIDHLHVIGAGPAGRLLAAAASRRGLDVTLSDPSLAGQPNLPATIGVWMDQLPDWLPDGFLRSRFQPQVIVAEPGKRGSRSVKLSREYGVVDNQELAQLGGYQADPQVITREQMDAEDEAPKTAVVFTTGKGLARSKSTAVADAGGEREPAASPYYQFAYGQVFRETDLPDKVRQPTLMDFRRPDRPEVPKELSAELAHLYDTIPTFSYRLPLGDGTWLIEETILATAVRDQFPTANKRTLHHPRVTVANAEAALQYLRLMQGKRLEMIGVDSNLAIDDEVVAFPMLSPLLNRADITNKTSTPSTTSTPSKYQHWGFGSVGVRSRSGKPAGSWLHPATGYSVGATAATVDSQVERILAGIAPQPPGGRFAGILLRRGLGALLEFPPRQTQIFFSAFFDLAPKRIEAYLTPGSTSRSQNRPSKTANLATNLELLRTMLALAVPLIRRDKATLWQLLKGFSRGVIYLNA